MNEEKPYVELLLSSANPHTSFLSLSQTILEADAIQENEKKHLLHKVVDAYEEICQYSCR
ncbi:hypothetical protein SAMN05192534_10277 [Alteribacillus persepolensis]|uniref:Uncharacterized protein n=1 Tax=Alteribacillus persepolensis TaxID=568899 RepID=A0A1G8AA07_9BACI|nr:hypothetical protein [Alteribacillus persepolensis]SDH17676.1 hypothetical protein SAMN05192534_10277 [Alteribacillus persepolensis]